MRRRVFLVGIGTAVGVLAGPGSAQTVVDGIVEQLQGAQYNNIRIRRTLLGRIRITAEGPIGSREIVVNRSTGGILRDHTVENSTHPQPRAEGENRAQPTSRDRPSAGGGGTTRDAGQAGERPGPGGPGPDRSDPGRGGQDGKAPDRDGPGGKGPDKDGPDRGGPGKGGRDSSHLLPNKDGNGIRLAQVIRKGASQL